MGFDSSVKALLETYSNCVSLLKSLRPHKRSQEDDGSTTKTDDQQVTLLKSLKKDRALVERAYSSRLSETGGKLRKGDARAMSALDRILKRIRVTVTKLLRIASKEQTPTLDYESLMTLSNSSRIDAIRTIDNLSRRLGSNNTSRATMSHVSTKSRAPPATPSPPSPPARRKSRSSHVSSHDGSSPAPAPTKPIKGPSDEPKPPKKRRSSTKVKEEKEKPTPSKPKSTTEPPATRAEKEKPAPVKQAPPTEAPSTKVRDEKEKPPSIKQKPMTEPSWTKMKGKEKEKHAPSKPKPVAEPKVPPAVLSKLRKADPRKPAVPDAPPLPSTSPKSPTPDGKSMTTIEFEAPPRPSIEDEAEETISHLRPAGVAQRLAAAAQNRVSIASFATDSTKLGEIPERRLRSFYPAIGSSPDGGYNTRPSYPLKPYKVEVKERGFWGGLFGRKKEQ